MNDFVPPMRRRADLEKIALVTCRSELEKVKAINVELLAACRWAADVIDATSGQEASDLSAALRDAIAKAERHS